MRRVLNDLGKWRVILSQPKTFPSAVLKTRLHIYLTLPISFFFGLLLAVSLQGFNGLFLIALSASLPYVIALSYLLGGRLFGLKADFNDLLAVPFWGLGIILLGGLPLLLVTPVIILFWWIGVSQYLLALLVGGMVILSLIAQIRMLMLSFQASFLNAFVIYLLSIALVVGLGFAVLSLLNALQ